MILVNDFAFTKGPLTVKLKHLDQLVEIRRTPKDIVDVIVVRRSVVYYLMKP
jgi:hypothetical protein